jgi:DNA sulfur modification protein DndB
VAMLSVVRTEFEHDSVELARNAAFEEATATGGRVFPCTVGSQGDRLILSAMLPLQTVAKHVRFDSAVKGSSARQRLNRPIMPDHVRTIYTYLRDNPEKFILPPVTLNSGQMPQVHVARSNAAVRIGFLVVDDAALFAVTDGQHRIAAIAGYHSGTRFIPGILADHPEFGKYGLAVQITVESEPDRVHQDFADAAQTKPIPASLLAVYNTREPVNRVLTKIVEGSTFLHGRIDETSKTLPKLSQHVFLLNQVRGFVKELLFSDYAMSDDTLRRLTAQRLDTQAKQERFVSDALQLLNVLTEKMTPWSKIAALPLGSAAANQIPDFRAQYLNMTATGLIIIGRVAHQIDKLYDLDHHLATRLEKYSALAKEIDWQRSSNLWQGNVVNSEGKILTNRAPVAMAATRVKERLGLTAGTQPPLMDA